MDKLNTFQDIHAELAKYVPPTRSMRGAYTLDRMKLLMDKLGNPQNSYKTIHVAGTSGKTSTCYYLTSMLKASGKKVGLTVSPHIDEVNERVQIDLTPLDEIKFCKELAIFIGKVEKTGVRPTYFELLVAFAFWEFDREKVDYAVVEVGLGGLLDGTNVINNTDKVCIITDISLDHVEVLGQTLPEIAAQKAGIIMPHNTIFTYDQHNEVMEVIREVCAAQHSVLHEVWPLGDSELPKNLPLFQRRNWYLALSVHEYLVQRDDLRKLDEAELRATTTTYIPARMEFKKLGDKTLIMDGAHNAQKMRAFADSVKQRFPGEPIAAVFSLVQSKKPRSLGTLREITKLVDHLIITTFDTEQDMRKVSVDPAKIAEYCEEIGFTDWEIVPEPEETLAIVRQRPEKIILVTGSFYLLNHIRPVIFHD